MTGTTGPAVPRAVVLGSGTAVPSLSRGAPGLLVTAGQAVILFDMGPGTMGRLLKAGVTVDRVTHVFLTHRHLDHSGELAAFLFARKYPGFDTASRTLTVGGGPGMREFMGGLFRLYGSSIEQKTGSVAILEFDGPGWGSCTVGSLEIRTLPLEHTESSVGFRLETAEHRSLVVTGDTAYCANAVRLAGKADILICEASTPDGQGIAGHLTPSEAGRIAREADVKRLVLTHFYPECDGADLAAQCRKAWPGPLTLAEDGMAFSLEGGD